MQDSGEEETQEDLERRFDRERANSDKRASQQE